MEVHVKHIQFTKNCVKLTSGLVKGVFIGLGRKIKTSPLVCSKCSAMHRHGKLREICAASQRLRGYFATSSLSLCILRGGSL